jgi:hypothetical protein
MEELLLGLRTSDAPSETFHSGDPKLRGKRERKSKVGYIYLDEPLNPRSEAWHALAVYPEEYQRHKSLPRIAFKQASGSLEFLGMPAPKIKGSNMPAFNGAAADPMSHRPFRYEEEEPEQPPVTTAIGLELQIVASEMVEKQTFLAAIGEEERDAEEYLEDLQEVWDPQAFEPKVGRRQAELDDADTLTSVAAFDTGCYQPLDVRALIDIRHEGETTFRLTSEKTRANATTLSEDLDDELVTQKQATKYLRDRRQVSSSTIETAVRARQDNSRQVRWDHRETSIAASMKELAARQNTVAEKYCESIAVSPTILDKLHIGSHGGGD